MIERRSDMNEDHKKAISKANKGNSHSSKENREKNKMLKNIIKEVVMDDDGLKAKEIIQALVNKATDGDLRAIEILLDRIDGKVVQESKIDGNMGHDFNIPIRVITGIDDEDDEPIEVTPQPEDNSIRKVTREQAKIEDERGWKGMTMSYVGTEGMFDDDGNLIPYEERMDMINKKDM
jgi:hypothetical protein